MKDYKELMQLKKEMKLNYLFNLQKFADDGDGGDDGANNESESTGDEANEPKENEGEDGKNKKYTDDDVNKIIENKFKAWEKKHQKEVDEAKKLAEMNEREKAEYEAQKLKEELEELKGKETLSNITREARKMFAEKDINVSDELLTALVNTDAEKTKTAVDSFISLFTSAVEKGVKEALKGDAPKKKKSSAGLTKEDIMKIKNPIERQKAIKENIELFEK